MSNTRREKTPLKSIPHEIVSEVSEKQSKALLGIYNGEGIRIYSKIKECITFQHLLGELIIHAKDIIIHE